MELLVPIDAKSNKPLYEQIYAHIRREIRSGGLKTGERLPSTRTLAEHLKVSRSTTQMAYDQLVAEGYAEARPYRGYFVARLEELAEAGPRMEEPVNGSGENGDFGVDLTVCDGGFGTDLAAGDGTVLSGKVDSFGMDLPDESGDFGTDLAAGSGETGAGGGDWIDFSPRGIDLDSFPFNTWRKLIRTTLIDDNREFFHSGDHQGDRRFREAIGGYLHSARGVNCRPEQIIIGAGSEYLLMLLSLILGTDRRIAMEDPTYIQAYRVFSSLGYPVIPLEMDDWGMEPGRLERSGADVAYVMPSHQYPTGIVMPVGRRQELLRWASDTRGGQDRYLIEDDYDSEFRYKGKPIPALQGMDRKERVIYMGTFSKAIAPAIRVSYMVLPPGLLRRYRSVAGFYASTVSRIDQNVLYQFMAQGHFERHLNRMRAIYRAKHDAMLGAIRPLERDFDLSGENAGLHILLTDRWGRTEEELIEKAAEAGVGVYGLSRYYIRSDTDHRPATIVIGYASLDEKQIRAGGEKLVEALS